MAIMPPYPAWLAAQDTVMNKILERFFAELWVYLEKYELYRQWCEDNGRE